MTARVEQNEIIRAVRPVLEGQGFELVAVFLARVGRRSLVRVLADKPGGGIQLSECAQISKAVSAALEGMQAMEGPYTLEVSSPGLDWRCETLEDLRRYRGQSMTFQMVDGQKLTGVLTEASQDWLELASGERIPREQVRYGTRNY